MTPEGKIEAYLKKRVLAAGGRIRKLSWPGHRGAPDRMIWWPVKERMRVPVLVFVEVKAPGKRATKQQARKHNEMSTDGFDVRVLSSKDQVDVFVKIFADLVSPRYD